MKPSRRHVTIEMKKQPLSSVSMPVTARAHRGGATKSTHEKELAVKHKSILSKVRFVLTAPCSCRAFFHRMHMASSLHTRRTDSYTTHSHSYADASAHDPNDAHTAHAEAQVDTRRYALTICSDTLLPSLAGVDVSTPTSRLSSWQRLRTQSTQNSRLSTRRSSLR